MQARGANFLLYIGYDDMRHMDIMISLNWNRRSDVKEFESMFHNYVEVSWNWLPVLRRVTYPMDINPSDNLIHLASDWTGRVSKYWYFRWPFSFGCKLT